MINHSVTVLIAHLPERAIDLHNALMSVALQTHQCCTVVVTEDHKGEGSAATRNHALERVRSEWVLPLDDDDLLMPNAVQLLCEAQAATNADIVSGRAWQPQTPSHGEPIAPPSGWIPKDTILDRSVLNVSSLMRTEDVRRAHGWHFKWDEKANLMLDDWGLYRNLALLDKTFYRIPDHTLIWNITGSNTSGQTRDKIVRKSNDGNTRQAAGTRAGLSG